MVRLQPLAVLIALVSAFVLLANEPSVQRPDGRKIAVSQIDITITRLMEAAHVTGTGIAIFHQGRIAYLKSLWLSRC